ncbi:hypothetical protein NS29R_08250 [Enterobacter hormaechei subsp. xiangfangensis]|nr:hypothetical protein NS23R_08440 [Enterobacter hormaechei]KTQ64339.1 hypothetical protein NS28R_02900 [Enterobacter hormaechei subsp. xiangfangensis]KTQ62826.1 hypothetical protein NS34R_13950 [Enterobacter hormaechei]KTQ70390.1 hypothetical protein NS19R_08725 [Enterobacter hormaechei subsp. xiangfangensis]KTQ83241.1 hypothetical protein NS7_01890 [Enterobacter hormaechei]
MLVVFYGGCHKCLLIDFTGDIRKKSPQTSGRIKEKNDSNVIENPECKREEDDQRYLNSVCELCY